MRAAVTVGIMVAMFAVGIMVGVWVSASSPETVVREKLGRVVHQDRFPCEEDEVLTYDPRFGPEHVGCVHVEEIKE